MENLKYVPVFRSRQQENLVLNEFDFGDKIFPIIEIVKEKDRKNNQCTSFEIYSNLIKNVRAEKVFLDLPVYIQLSNSTNEEVVIFSRTVLENTNERIKYIKQFCGIKKVIPVISGLSMKTGEVNTIVNQFNALKSHFENIAFRVFHNSFDLDYNEISTCIRLDKDILIYDLDNISITSPVFRIQRKRISEIIALRKIIVRSAIGNEIQNTKLEHCKVVAEADNSLLELFDRNGFDSFGDYAGIKKDDLTSGGTISPGLIFFDPSENLYYGYKSEVKKLEEFERTIVPAVLGSNYIKYLEQNKPEYIKGNGAMQIMRDIISGTEAGKSQAKFKKIAILNYLHCIKTTFDYEYHLPLL